MRLVVGREPQRLVTTLARFGTVADLTVAELSMVAFLLSDAEATWRGPRTEPPRA